MQGDQPREISPPTDQGALISSLKATGSNPFPPMTIDTVMFSDGPLMRFKLGGRYQQDNCPERPACWEASLFQLEAAED